ncbi:MAG TPA: hypothetical protein ENG33_09755 [Chloroflexi bacterium]|nr:hypothetical protein [Chloroflexota bacterium]
MAKEALQELVGKAIIDKEFEYRLLHQPEDVLGTLNLSPEEESAVLSIKANSLSQFASQLHKKFFKEVTLWRPRLALNK